MTRVVVNLLRFSDLQVVVNACATQAILSILLNSPKIDLGPTLSEFKSITGEFSPEVRDALLILA